MDCIFCKITKGEVPSYKIFEDGEFIAFLDNFPCVEGQTLVIPKRHVGYFVDMNDAEYKKIMVLSKKIAKAIQKTFNPVKVGVIIEGLEVNHVHVKLFPLPKEGFAKIIKCNPKLSKEDMVETAEKIKANL